jgi:hypothetical protein
MTSAQLSHRLQQPFDKETSAKLAHELWSTSFPIRKLVDFCFSPHAQVALHAAWILEQICFEDFEYFFKYFAYLAEKIPTVVHDNVKRHFAKIIAHTLQHPNKQEELTKWKKKRSEAVAKTLFEWFVDATVKPGVKVWCIESLAILSVHHPWVREELPPCIETQLPDAPKGLLVRMKKFLQATS